MNFRPLPLVSVLLGSALLLGCGSSEIPGSRTPAEPVTTPVAVTPCAGNAIDPQRLFLQQVGSDRALIKWRGNKATGGAEADTLCLGTSATALTQVKAAQTTATRHREVRLTGLTPDTPYFYTVGGGSSPTKVHRFRTAPLTGNSPADGNIRAWIVGDAGTATASQMAVRDGYLKWVADNGGEPTDLFLMLGDNAYLDGTDAQHQAAVFDLYPTILSEAGLWPTIGNHEMGTSGVSVSPLASSYIPAQGQADALPDSPMPYLNIHTLPTQGESGGVPSGTEQYYSADYGNVHIISLDSQLSSRDAAARSAMLEWLRDDLEANTGHWTIVIFHHPPYTKGSHDSDTNLLGIDQPIFDMREEFTPVFEQFGVDLVYGGHSHSYERSKYIHKHTGLAATFADSTMAELNSAGVPASGQGAEAYGQITKSGQDDKVVYTVAGSSGGQSGGTSSGYPHRAMFFSTLDYGSVVVDAKQNRLDASFIDANGAVLDSFTMTR